MTAGIEPFDQLYVINLKERTDRRQEMATELARVGLKFGADGVRLFEAVRPSEDGGFPSIGARGCFLSHLTLLQDALAQGHERIVILEDDAALAGMSGDFQGVLADLAGKRWDLAYFGHSLPEPEAPGDAGGIWERLESTRWVKTTHAMALRAPAMAEIVPYFQAMMARQPGDPAGGPMHVDGAYSWFRKEHPETVTLAAMPSLVHQRSSQSDIFPPTWKDRVPFAPALRRALRVLKR